jgi:hypothetical protein
MINLDKLFADHQLYHSDFQMDNLITVRAGGTLYGQYKQALRELYKRYRGLKQLCSERELLQVDIDELAVKKTCNQFEARRNEINRKTKLLSMDELNKNIKDTEREFQRFYAQACALKEQIGELTPENRDKLDRDMWEYKLKEMAAIDFLSQGRLGNVTVETIAAAPIEMRKEILRLISPQNHGELIQWFETKNSEPLALSETSVDIKLLLE